MYKFEMDIGELLAGTRFGPIASGTDVLGPNERIIGSTNHVYRRIQDDIFIHIQNFQIEEPYVYRTIRRGHLTIQFIIAGSYLLGLPSRLHKFRSSTVRISGFPHSDTYLPAKNVAGFCIMVRPSFLVDQLGLAVDRIPRSYRALFNDSKGVDLSMELPISPAMWLAIEEIIYCNFAEPLRGVFLNAKAIELMCYVVARLNTLRPTQPFVGVSKETREQQMIEFAERIYRQELNQPPSIDQLARRVGLNKNRLIAAFRERFGETPAQYSRDVRLKWAHDRLLDGQVSVAEIAAAVGYDSPAAFSRAFFERYGYSPSSVRADGAAR